MKPAENLGGSVIKHKSPNFARRNKINEDEGGSKKLGIIKKKPVEVIKDDLLKAREFKKDPTIIKLLRNLEYKLNVKKLMGEQLEISKEGIIDSNDFMNMF